MSMQLEQATLHKPVVKALTLENVKAFIDDGRQASLTVSQLNTIEKYLQTNASAIELSKLLNDLMNVYQHFNDLAGLTRAETEKLRELAAIRREFKNTHKKGQYDGPAFKRFIANERKIVSFNQSMQWWQHNIETLRKLALWEDLDTIINNTAQKEHLPDNELKQRLYKLNDIKHAWAKHQLFGAFSSDHLLEFYQSYLVVVEKILANIIAKNKIEQNDIQQFLVNVLQNIKSLQKQAVHSMLARLTCMAAKKDIESDDILRYYIEVIETECHIEMSQNGKRPPSRKGLRIDTIHAFLSELNAYIEANPSEKWLEDAVATLDCVHKPYRWSTFNSETIQKSVLANNSIIIFCANQINSLLTEGSLKQNVYSDILESDISNSEDIIFYKIKKMLALTQAEISKQAIQSNNKLDQEIINDISDWHDIYEKQIKDVRTRISIAIRNKIHRLIENVFSNEKLDYENLGQLMDYLARSDEFDSTYLKTTYDPDKDILLALAAKLKQAVEKNQPITEDMLDNAKKLLTMLYEGMNISQISNLNACLKALPSQIRNIHVNDDPYIMHYIVQHIESAFLTHESIQTALKRHQYITNLYDEEKNPLRYSSIDKNALTEYVRYVLMPLAQECPSITLDNFSENDIIDKIIKLSMQAKEPEIDLNTINQIKAQYENEILQKINNLFAVKRYLYANDNKNIDINKLSILIEKVKQFYSSQDHQQAMLQTIAKSCSDLIKNYLISAIQSDLEPDFYYIDEINRRIGANILTDVLSDHDLTKLLMNYIELYSGSCNKISNLLIKLGADMQDTQTNNIIYIYAAKRLGYISSSHSVCSQDYYFFDHYKENPSVRDLFRTHKSKLKQTVSEWANSQYDWSENKAQVIELFGQDNDIDKYRLKRINELLKQSVSTPLSNSDADKMFCAFSKTINPFKKMNSRTRAMIIKQLDDAVFQQPWNLLLEKIIAYAGNIEQRQAVHFTFLSKQLTQYAVIDDSWLGNELSQMTNKDDYIAFIGDKNIIKLCAQIDKQLTRLQDVNSLLNKNAISTSDYNLYMSMLTSLKSLKPLYEAFSSNPSGLKMMAYLPDIEMKIQLHQMLHSSIKNHTSLLSIASENTTLHNLILSISKSVADLEENHFITSKNATQYITFCNEEVIKKIDYVLGNKDFALNYEALTLLEDLLTQLPSNHLKLQLSLAHKHDSIDNPIWLMLINHMDEKSGLATVMNYLTHSSATINPGEGFSELLTFSKNFNQTKQHIHQLIKSSLLNEAKIKHDATTNIDFDALKKPTVLSNKQLFTLWKVCISKLEPKHKPLTVITSSLKYTAKLAMKVGEELLLRSQSDSSLLTQFTHSFSMLSDLYKSRLAPENKITSSHANSSSFWPAKTDLDLFLTPITNLARRAAIIGPDGTHLKIPNTMNQ